MIDVTRSQAGAILPPLGLTANSPLEDIWAEKKGELR
jgi:hypothetical protein